MPSVAITLKVPVVIDTVSDTDKNSFKIYSVLVELTPYRDNSEKSPLKITLYKMPSFIESEDSSQLMKKVFK